MSVITATIKDLGVLPVSDPKYGDMKLNVFPINHLGRRVLLPNEFKLWETEVNRILQFVPLQPNATQHYVTIDSKFFTVPETLRREGIHADGNFCVDPTFQGATWGGTTTTTTWGGAKYHPEFVAVTPWVSPYGVYPPVGTYVSELLGGILCASSYVGCQAWQGEFQGEVASEGCCDHLADQFTEDKKVVMEANRLYFMTSNTPHETLLIPKGVRRTFIRLTLDHRYENKALLCA